MLISIPGWDYKGLRGGICGGLPLPFTSLKMADKQVEPPGSSKATAPGMRALEQPIASSWISAGDILERHCGQVASKGSQPRDRKHGGGFPCIGGAVVVDISFGLQAAVKGR